MHSHMATRRVQKIADQIAPATCASAITRRDLSNPNMAQSVEHNGVLYLAGQVGADFESSTAEQTKQVLDKIDALLADAGTDKSRCLDNWSLRRLTHVLCLLVLA